MVSKLGRKYLAKADAPDPRDKFVEVKIQAPVSDEVVDLRAFLAPIRDQGSLGSCTGHAAGAHREFLYRKYFEYEKDKTVPAEQFSVSPLFIYYKEREMEGTINEDAGAQIRSTVKVLNQFGACLESRDVYDVHNYRQVPTQDQDKVALTYKSGAYHRVEPGIEEMKSVLRSGYTIIIGMTVYESFEDNYTARTGEMLVPNVDTEQCLGGHAVLVCGFDEEKQHFIVRNSWGAGWGDKGYFYMNYKIADLPDLITDMWISHLGPAWKLKTAKTKEAEPAVDQKLPETKE